MFPANHASRLHHAAPHRTASLTHSLAIKSITGQPPRGWYYGMVQTKAGARSRGLVARTYAEEALPLKYYSDDYSDDLPYWVKYPGGTGKQEEGAKGEGQGLLIVPYA